MSFAPLIISEDYQNTHVVETFRSTLRYRIRSIEKGVGAWVMHRAVWPYGDKGEACGNGKRLAMPCRCRSPFQPGKLFPFWVNDNQTKERQSHRI